MPDYWWYVARADLLGPRCDLTCRVWPHARPRQRRPAPAPPGFVMPSTTNRGADIDPAREATGCVALRSHSLRGRDLWWSRRSTSSSTATPRAGALAPGAPGAGPVGALSCPCPRTHGLGDFDVANGHTSVTPASAHGRWPWKRPASAFSASPTGSPRCSRCSRPNGPRGRLRGGGPRAPSTSSRSRRFEAAQRRAAGPVTLDRHILSRADLPFGSSIFLAATGRLSQGHRPSHPAGSSGIERSTAHHASPDIGGRARRAGGQRRGREGVDVGPHS